MKPGRHAPSLRKWCAAAIICMLAGGLPAGASDLSASPQVASAPGPGFRPSAGRGAELLSAHVVAGTGHRRGGGSETAALQPVVLLASAPETVATPEGAAAFDLSQARVAAGLYQVAISESGAVFVTAASGAPQVTESAIYRLDPVTLAVVGRGMPAPLTSDGEEQDGEIFALYGLAVDDANGKIWVTNTRQNSLAVYRQNDLSLVKQFESGSLSHPRDVVVDQKRSRAYAGSATSPRIDVFHSGGLEKSASVALESTRPGGTFGVTGLTLGRESGRLYAVSMQTSEYAVIEPGDLSVRVFALPEVRGASGIAVDEAGGLVFIAVQESGRLLILRAGDGRLLRDVPVGAGALNVVFDPVSRRAFVADRLAGTVSVVTPEGLVEAVLPVGGRPNHLTADDDGRVWLVTKSRGAADETGDRLWRITPKPQ